MIKSKKKIKIKSKKNKKTTLIKKLKKSRRLKNYIQPGGANLTGEPTTTTPGVGLNPNAATFTPAFNLIPASDILTPSENQNLASDTPKPAASLTPGPTDFYTKDEPTDFYTMDFYTMDEWKKSRNGYNAYGVQKSFTFPKIAFFRNLKNLIKLRLEFREMILSPQDRLTSIINSAYDNESIKKQKLAFLASIYNDRDLPINPKFPQLSYVPQAKSDEHINEPNYLKVHLINDQDLIERFAEYPFKEGYNNYQPPSLSRSGNGYGDTYSHEQIAKHIDAYNRELKNVCIWCTGTEFSDKTDSPWSKTREHICPMSCSTYFGQNNILPNIRWAHKFCNMMWEIFSRKKT